MKKTAVVIGLLFFSFIAAAQDKDLIDWDIDAFDSIFDDPGFSDEKVKEAEAPPSVLKSVKQRGIVFKASYELQGGIAPGWDIRPWEFDGEEVFTWRVGIKMNSVISIDARLSEAFRVITNLSYGIPGFNFSLDDFFFDYNILDKVFIRAGKYTHSWGIGGFTNLLSRIPTGSSGGDSYIVKLEVPVDVGGIQALMLTRADISGGVIPAFSDFGFGGKYNLALRWADFDLGVFYQDNMATRAFLSTKTTIVNTELYNEWLLAVNTHSDKEVSFAANLGFGVDFFDGKISTGGEFVYNGEGNTYFYRPESSVRDAEVVPFIESFSMSMKMLYRFSGAADPRFFVSLDFSPSDLSAHLIPGFRINPFSELEVYLAFPMSLGSRDSYLYKYTADPYNRPFSIVLFVTFKGSVQASYYY